MDEDAKAVLEFWFEETEREKWFIKDPAFDDTIRERFSGVLDALTAAPERAMAWADLPLGAVAAVVALDQFPRNLFRDGPGAFARDSVARDVARKAVALGHHADRSLTLEMKVFLFLPFEHSESSADQDWSVALIGSLGDADYLDYAERHRDIVQRFGRFPHRNATLGRNSTAEEAEFLTQPGSSF